MKKLILLGLLMLVSCKQKENITSGLTNYVPNGTFAVIQINDLAAFKSDLRNNNFINQFENSAGYSNFDQFLSRLDYIEPKDHALICFNEVGKDNFEYTFISEYHEQLFKKDSLQDIVSERYNYENLAIDEISLKGQKAFHTLINRVAIISSSKLVIENIIRQSQSSNYKTDASLQKIIDTSSPDATASIFINGENGNTFVDYLFPESNFLGNQAFKNWIGIDAKIDQQNVFFNGVTISKDSTGSVLSVFENLGATENKLPEITPLNAHGLLSFTYTDWNILSDKLKVYAGNKVASANAPDIMPFSDEAGFIYLKEGNVIALHFNNIEGVKTELESYSKLADTHRSIPIQQLETYTLLIDNLDPLVSNTAANFYTVLGDFVVFAENLTSLHGIIANFQNKSTLKNTNAYETLMKNLNDQSSILAIGMNPQIGNFLEEKGNNVVSKTLTSVKLDEYPLFAFQFVPDKDFLHTNGAISRISKSSVAGTVSQLFAVTLEAELANKPQFVTNHRTEEKDIVIQDKANHLYLISNEGKIRWKRKLDDPIIGEVSQVDLYKNGRLQLAFTTEKKLHIIDLKGRDVAPFPLDIDAKVTHPLSVFDYDKNRNYRFVVCANKEIFMYTGKGEKVDGFTFKRTKQPLLSSPKHVRVSGKDYLILPQQNRLSILDRRGKPRIKVNGEINLSGNSVYLYNGLFTTTDSSGNLLQIDFKGNINRIGLGLQDNHKIDATAKTLVSLSDNVLTIKGKPVELDYGIYTAPRIFYVNNKIYVSVTDLQTSKVYLFDSQTEPIANFPVYGNSEIDLTDLKNNNKIAVVTEGEENSIIVYALN
ncbi:ribonuclease HII [Flavobacteriaceae bacterium M23B6Z8]